VALLPVKSSGVNHPSIHFGANSLLGDLVRHDPKRDELTKVEKRAGPLADRDVVEDQSGGVHTEECRGECFPYPR
jgi:hypothetical protein